MNTVKTKWIAAAVVFTMAGEAFSDEEFDLEKFRNPPNECRTKTWWFFGQTETTEEGIIADLDALKTAGFGGVVYYDQVHGPNPNADKLFSPEWWEHLDFAAAETAKREMSFEINVGNGYVAGGRHIRPEDAMKKLAWRETLVSCPSSHVIVAKLPLPKIRDGWYEDVAVFAIRAEIDPADIEIKDAGETYDAGRAITLRHAEWSLVPEGKNLNGAMQHPGEMSNGERRTRNGCGYRELPPWGKLEASNDGENWREVVKLNAIYRTLGGYPYESAAFTPVSARYWRVTGNGERRTGKGFRWLKATSANKISRIVTKNGEVSEVDLRFADDCDQRHSMASDITDKMSPDGILRWEAPDGSWRILRFVSVLTGAKTKHGHPEALGYECDKLSKRGARAHWDAWTLPVIRHLRNKNLPLAGVVMDSHEEGSQNWTQDMLVEFEERRGYDFRPFLPAMAGFRVDGGEKALADFRRTLSEMIADNYYGEFGRLCSGEGLTLTAQAIGAALCMTGDSILSKRDVAKPQGEFWAYQKHGAYDIKDCSSAAHLYDKKIASAEALTDTSYKQKIPELRRLCDIAYSFGANEFVICATPHMPSADATPNTVVGGREYGINRTNPWWGESRAFWDYQARCAYMLRLGEPAPDLLVYLGDQTPNKILTHRLPDDIAKYDWDAATYDALMNSPNIEKYRAVKIAKDAVVGSETAARLAALAKPDSCEPGLTAPDGIAWTHRRTATHEIYFIANTSSSAISLDEIKFRDGTGVPITLDPWTGETCAMNCVPPGGSLFSILKSEKDKQ